MPSAVVIGRTYLLSGDFALLYVCTPTPTALGVLAVFAGLGLLTFLHMPLGYHLFPYIAALGLLGAVPQILWLLVFGVNAE